MTNCDQCTVKFSLLKRRHVCDACQLIHCSDCLTRMTRTSCVSSSSSSGSRADNQPHPGYAHYVYTVNNNGSTNSSQNSSASFPSGFPFSSNFMWNGRGLSAASQGVSAQQQQQQQQQQLRQCKKCVVFSQWPIDVDAVSALRVKDLRFYLNKHNINASTCREKIELIALVVNQLKRFRLQSSSTQQQQQHQKEQAAPSQSSQYRPSGWNSSSAFSCAPSTAATVIRDDGIRVRGMDAATDDIRVFASSPSDAAVGSLNIEDDFVVVEHPDVASPSGEVCSGNVSGGTRRADSGSSLVEGSVGACRRNSRDGNESPLASSTGRRCSDSNPLSSSRENDSRRTSSTNASLDDRESSEAGGTMTGVTTPKLDTTSTATTTTTTTTTSTTTPTVITTATTTSTTTSTTSSTKNFAQNKLQLVQLDDLPDEESVRALSVRQCRMLLCKHRVTTTAIIEKEQLIARVLTLWHAYQENKSVDNLPDRMLCNICMEAAIDCVLLECGHMVCCTDCGRQLSECPICRQFVVRCVHTFLA